VARTYADDGVRVASYDLARCERETRRRAGCEVTYVLTDGSECDDTIHVTLSKRGKVTARADSGRGRNRVFEDCAEPPEPADEGELDEGQDDELDVIDALADEGESEGDLPVAEGPASEEDLLGR
jgi:hypothetical protein